MNIYTLSNTYKILKEQELFSTKMDKIEKYILEQTAKLDQIGRDAAAARKAAESADKGIKQFMDAHIILLRSEWLRRVAFVIGNN